MNFKSQKGYSLVEVGVGLVIISIFMYCGITIIRGTYNTYRMIEQKNIAMSYLIKGTEKELIDEKHEDDSIKIVENPALTVITWPGDDPLHESKKTVITNIDTANMRLETYVTPLDQKDGNGTVDDYNNAKVKLISSTVYYKLKANDTVERQLKLETLKVEEDAR